RDSQHRYCECDKISEIRWKAQCADIAAADLFEWPRLEEPLRSRWRAMFEGSSGGAHSFTQRAKIDVVNYDPPTRPNESRNANQIQGRSRMLVVCIDED